MTLDEAIKQAEEVAEENQRVVDTGIVFDDITIDEFYCDDTEAIAEHLVSCETCSEEHRQLAEWLKDYKRLLEQKPKAAEPFDILRFVADNAGLSTFEAIEKAYNMGASQQEPVLDKIRAEIESNMESVIGKYDSSIPKFNMPSYKIERDKVRKECMDIIDKYKAEMESEK